MHEYGERERAESGASQHDRSSEACAHWRSGIPAQIN